MAPKAVAQSAWVPWRLSISSVMRLIVDQTSPTTVINRPPNASDFSHKIVKSSSSLQASLVRVFPKRHLES